MRILNLKNFRKGLATNSSSTHSIIYKKKGHVLEDLNVFELNYYGRFDNTIAATKEAKLKYVLCCVQFDETIVKLLEQKYPEIKQYYPLIKKRAETEDWEVFGEHSRGELIPKNSTNKLFDYERLVNIIEDTNIVIIGGSDEGKFVNNTVEEHGEKNYEMPYHYRKPATIFKNGNYYVYYYEDWDGMKKARFCVDQTDTPIPQHPELLDINLTDSCRWGCKYCVTEDTMIETVKGQKQIKDVQLSDQVYTFNLMEQKEMVGIVTQLYKRKYRGDLICIEHNNQIIKLTPNHKIYTQNRGYIRADEINENDIFLDF